MGKQVVLACSTSLTSLLVVVDMMVFNSETVKVGNAHVNTGGFAICVGFWADLLPAPLYLVGAVMLNSVYMIIICISPIYSNKNALPRLYKIQILPYAAVMDYGGVN